MKTKNKKNRKLYLNISKLLAVVFLLSFTFSEIKSAEAFALMQKCDSVTVPDLQKSLVIIYNDVNTANIYKPNRPVTILSGFKKQDRTVLLNIYGYDCHVTTNIINE